MAVFTSQAEMEARSTPARVVQLFDDDGSGQITGANLVRMNEVLAETDDTIRSSLFDKGFTLEQLELLAPDRRLRQIATDIALQLGGERRTEFQSEDGSGPYDLRGERARADLRRLSTGELRSKLEPVVGINPVVLGDVNVTVPQFTFSRDPNDPRRGPGPGGF